MSQIYLQTLKYNSLAEKRSPALICLRKHSVRINQISNIFCCCKSLSRVLSLTDMYSGIALIGDWQRDFHSTRVLHSETFFSLAKKHSFPAH